MSLPWFIETPDPSIWLSDNYVVLDFEIDTSHGDYGHAMHPANQMLLACWTFGPEHAQYDNPFTDRRANWGNELQMGDLLLAIEQADFIVAHKSKYELGWLARCGLDLHDVLVFDTNIAEYVLAGNQTKIGLSLDDCGIRRGMRPKDTVVDLMMNRKFNPVDMPKKWLEDRCLQDVETTEAVFRDQRRRLTASGRLAVLYTRCLLTPVLAATEPEGMKLDVERVEAEYAIQMERLGVLRQDMDRVTGGINWKSGKQIADVIYNKLGFEEFKRKDGAPVRTPSGRPMTDQNTLAKLTATTDQQREFISIRKQIGKVQARISKALDYFIAACRLQKGIIHAEFNQTVTQTHRLSSVGVKIGVPGKGDKIKYLTAQFQNIPRSYKRLFTAKREGWLICEADGAQLEFRTAMMLSGDLQGIADINDKEFDSHVFTAMEMNKATKAEVLANAAAAKKSNTDSWRQLAKPDTFKPLYGGEKGTPDQERYYEAFRTRYSTLTAVQESWEKQVRRHGFLRTAWGLTYYWPHAKIDRRGRLDCRRQIFNYPIQAFATAEIVPIAIVYLWHGLRETGLEEHVVLVNTVHDSVVMEVRNEPWVIARLEELCRWAFTDAVFKYLKNVYNFENNAIPLGMGIKVGTHWGEGDEHTYNVYSDGRQERTK